MSGGIKQKAFVKLKELVTYSPVLLRPDFTKEFIIQTDASQTRLGAVLNQVIDG